MIGIIQKTLVECMHDLGGEELRRSIFREAGVPEDRVFRMDENYPDEELAALLGATVKASGLEKAAVYELFARVFFRVVNDIFPELMSMANNSEDLIRMQVKIHTLIAAGQRDPGERQKVEDKFAITEQGDHEVSVRYRSPLQLCGLYKALAFAAANEFGDRIEIDTMRCRKRGDGMCEFKLRWMEFAGKSVDPALPEHGLIEARVGH